MINLAVQRPPPQVVCDGRAAKLDEPIWEELCCRLVLTDVSHGALVRVVEAWCFRIHDRVLIPSAEKSAQILALLRCDLCSRWLPAYSTIAKSKDLSKLCSLDSHAVINQQSTPVSLAILGSYLVAQCLGEGSHAYTCYPHKGSIVQAIVAASFCLQHHLVFSGLLHDRIQFHLNTAALQVFLNILTHFLLEHCQKARKGLYKRYLEQVLQEGKLVGQVLLDEVNKLSTELDSCGPTTHDDDPQ
mmetsp:Transcript_19735/g.35759  ORF Transcript_19735/g.35759 Transcript_19735/m.35759 type:complete len:244 (+) Transcript_19735:264-995(+)